MMLRRFAELAVTPWRNGRGLSRDVVTASDADGTLLWQVSLAELQEDGDFSDYAGFNRIFTPVAGDGIALSHDGGPFLPCPILIPQAFAGERRTRCRIGGTAGRAFNVVTAQGRFVAEVQVLRVPAGAPVPAGTVLHCWSGQLEAAGAAAGPGDSLLDTAAISAAPSTLILVHIAPA